MADFPFIDPAALVWQAAAAEERPAAGSGRAVARHGAERHRRLDDPASVHRRDEDRPAMDRAPARPVGRLGSCSARGLRRARRRRLAEADPAGALRHLDAPAHRPAGSSRIAGRTLSPDLPRHRRPPPRGPSQQPRPQARRDLVRLHAGRGLHPPDDRRERPGSHRRLHPRHPGREGREHRAPRGRRDVQSGLDRPHRRPAGGPLHGLDGHQPLVALRLVRPAPARRLHLRLARRAGRGDGRPRQRDRRRPLVHPAAPGDRRAHPRFRRIRPRPSRPEPQGLRRIFERDLELDLRPGDTGRSPKPSGAGARTRAATPGCSSPACAPQGPPRSGRRSTAPRPTTASSPSSRPRPAGSVSSSRCSRRRSGSPRIPTATAPRRATSTPMRSPATSATSSPPRRRPTCCAGSPRAAPPPSATLPPSSRPARPARPRSSGTGSTSPPPAPPPTCATARSPACPRARSPTSSTNSLPITPMLPSGTASTSSCTRAEPTSSPVPSGTRTRISRPS